MPHKASSALADRLLVLTLALEAALRENNFRDAQALFDERAQIIDQVGQSPRPCASTLSKICKINEKIELDMVAKSQLIAAELRKGVRGLKAHKAYRPFRESCAAPDSHA